MIAAETIPIKNLPCPSDNKSETSTEGDENYESHYCENFVFYQNEHIDLKTAKTKLKSSLCKNYAETGFCPYGLRCQFAHGTHQLRINMDANNSYKTKPCNAFFKKGTCQYGYRCNFVHQEPTTLENSTKWKIMYENHRDSLRQINRGKQSKLLRILQ